MNKMKRNHLIVLLAAGLLAAGGMQIQAAERRTVFMSDDGIATELIEESSEPVRMRSALYKFLNNPLVSVTTTTNIKRDPETGRLRARSSVYKFTCPTGRELITNVKEAFEADKDVAYTVQHFLPGQESGGYWNVKILTSDNSDDGIIFRGDSDEEGLSLYVTNAKLKGYRDAYCISWKVVGEKIKGTVVLATSPRPDVLERNVKAKEMVESLSPDELEAYRDELTKDMTFKDLSKVMEKYGITVPKKKIYSDTKMNDLATYRDQLQNAADKCLVSATVLSKRGTKADRLQAKEYMKQYKDYQKKLHETDKAIQKLLKKNK